MSKLVSIFHPFTGSAVGVPEARIPLFHSRPHVLAMEKLARDGFECRIDYISDRLLPYSVEKEQLRWKFHPVAKRWHSDSKKWKKQWSCWAALQYWLSTPEVTIINMSGHGSPFAFFLAKLIQQKKKAYITMIGGVHITLQEKQIAYYRNAAHILVHTERQKQELQGWEELTGCDIRVFPLGVDCEYFVPKKKPEDSNFPTLLFVGRIAALKRIHLAIEALSALVVAGFDKASLHIVGPISSTEYYYQLIEIINAKGLEQQVTFEGFIEHDHLIQYYQSADLLLLPSEHESFGMVMVEAMACGVPVAAIANSGGPDEIIQNRVNGILTTVEAYPAEVVEVIKCNKSLLAMQRAARETAISRYSIDATYQVLKQSVMDCLQ